MRFILCALALAGLALAALAVELPIEAESFTLGTGWSISDSGYFPAQPNLWSRTKIMADAGDAPAVATKTVEIPQAGAYRLWVRFESPYGFDTRFRVQIRQGDRDALNAVFGGRLDAKYFPFGRGKRVMGPWDWHNTDYVYQDATATLAPGPAQIVISKAANGQPGARRILDLLYLTDDLKLLPGDDWAQGNDSPPILSRFTVPVYLRCTGTGALQVDSSLYLIGYYKGAHLTRYLSKTGLTVAKPEAGAYLQAGERSAWGRLDVPSVMPPVLSLATLGTAPLTVEVAVDTPAHVVKTLTLAPGTPTDLVVGIGKAKYEAGLLGKAGALTVSEIFAKQTALVNAVKAPGTPAKRIPLATPLGKYRLDETFALARACGINAEFYDVNPAIYGAAPRLQGFIPTTGFITQQNAFMSRECYEGNFAALDALFAKAAADQQAALGRALPVHVKLIEEAGPPPIETLLAYPAVKERFIAYLATQGTTLEAALADRNIWHYETNRFRALLFAQTAAEATKLVEKYYPAGTKANSGSFYPTTGEYPALGRGDDCFTLFKARGVTEFCSEMSWGLGSTPDYMGAETESYEAALARALCKYHDATMGTYVISDGNRGYTGDFVETASYALLSQGFDWLSYYHLSYPGECSFLGNPDVQAGIKRVSHRVGQVEDALAGAAVKPAPVALGWSLTTDIWDLARMGDEELGPGNQVYPQERQLLYLLLRHLQVPVDLLSEEDLTDGYLKPYRAYVLVGDHLRPEAAAALRQWVQDGGTLISVAGGGFFDHYGRPLATLKDVFGINSATLLKAMPTLRPKLELVHAAPLDTITFADGKTMDVFAYRQAFEVGDGTVLGRFANGEAAAVAHPFGKGRAVIIGALPGAAYCKPAIPVKPFGRGGSDELSQFVPTRYAAGVAAVVQAALGDMPRPAVCSHPLVEATVLTGNGATLIPLVNYGAAPVKGLTVRLNLAALGAVREVRGSFGKVTVKRLDPGTLQVTVPKLDKWEVLIAR